MPDYKKDFPLLRDNQLVYLDNAATAQRPAKVLLAEQEFYEKYNANPLRGLYSLGLAATAQYESARERCVILFMQKVNGRSFLPEIRRRVSILWHTAMDFPI